MASMIHKSRRPKTRLPTPFLEQIPAPTTTGHSAAINTSPLAATATAPLAPVAAGSSAPVDNGPPAPNKVNLKIARHKGSSVAVDATYERLQASKYSPTPSLSQIIEDLTRENGRLRYELAFRYRLDKLGHDLQEEARYVIER